jgi:hypothetical protein
MAAKYSKSKPTESNQWFLHQLYITDELSYACNVFSYNPLLIFNLLTSFSNTKKTANFQGKPPNSQQMLHTS